MWLMILQMFWMLIVDLLFVAGLFLLMLPLGLARQAAYAVLKRNFVGYFSNPTGYVFLCLFVLLTSFAAFWPHEFFTANLANLDQLNKFLPYVMLAFIPAITMSIWSEERRQGTDELLLTLPTTDFDIVIGKYFAAVLVFTVSLLFSQLSNYAVLVTLTDGDVDSGLLFSTYLGYWFVGIAMLAIGMVASFLTNNLTVGFIFGVVFNAPLAFLSHADVLFSNSRTIDMLRHWSLLDRFSIFGRGLIGLTPIIYFCGIVVICLYLCLVLIGRRHWMGGKDGKSLFGHYLARCIALTAIVICICLVTEHSILNRVRRDISEGQVSTLSASTDAILDQLSESQTVDGEEQDRVPPVVIDAFVGAEVPPEYAQTKYDLVSLLKEFDARSGNRVQVNLHTGMRPFSEEATLAEKRFGIRPIPVQTRSQGAIQSQDVILGAAFTCGLERVVVPFFDYGIPVEYELIRSINTVSKSRRKTIGVVRSDVSLMGGATFNGVSIQPIPRSAIIRELEKQYDVEDINPSTPITVWLNDEEDPTRRYLRYDAMLVVQPSSLGPEELDNVVEAIAQGQPSAIFEDTMPIFFQVPGTIDPKQNQMAMFGGQPLPKGDITKLWNLLRIKVLGKTNSFSPLAPNAHLVPEIVWQDYNPYPTLKDLRNNPEYVFITPEALGADAPAGTLQPFNEESEITRGLQEVLIPFASPFEQTEEDYTFEYLLETGVAGTIGYDVLQSSLRNRSAAEDLSSRRGRADRRFTLAAHIYPNAEGEEGANDTQKSETLAGQSSEVPEINVVYVADIDCLHGNFFDFRSRPDAGEVVFRFQNITFVLNAIDLLSGDDAYIDIRKRTQRHKTLTAITRQKEKAYELVQKERQEFDKTMDDAQKQKQKELEEAIKPYEDSVQEIAKKKAAGEAIDPQVENYRKFQLEETRESKQRELETQVTELRRKRDEGIRGIERDADLRIQKNQTAYKIHAVLWPPIIPLLVGLVVFSRRRLREREGMSKLRRR